MSASLSLQSEVSAPGKIMLLGEYAVLEGGLALVAAVNRRARGRLVLSPSSPPSPIVEAVMMEARRRGLERAGAIEIDTETFRDSKGQKMGLGSSSAAAVVAAALVSERGDETALAIALEAHRRANGETGSGVDVASSFYGGVIAARRQPSPVAPLASRLKNLRLSVLFTGKSASTEDLVRTCRTAPSWRDFAGVLAGLAEEGVRAWEAQSSRAFVSVVARYGRAMASLGRAAGVNIVTEEIDAIMRIAEEAGGAAKPSGAGGGDVAVLWTLEDDTPHRIAERTGTQLLDVAIDPRGLSRK